MGRIQIKKPKRKKRRKERMESIFVNCCLKRIAETGSILCVELNPSLQYVPPIYQLTGNVLRNIEHYFFDVIEVAARLVPVVKFKAVDYSAFGKEGRSMLLRLIECAHHWGLLVILDVNQENIGNAVGKEAFKRYGADACILGPCSKSLPDFSCWMEWLKIGHMVISTLQFSKARTQLIQNSELSPSHWGIEDAAARIAESNAEVIRKTNGAGGIGIAIEVNPEQVASCRKFAGDDVFFLIPDYGVQVCGAKALLNGRGQTMGVVDTLSASILNSWQNQSRKKRPLEPVEEAIKALNSGFKMINK